MEEDPHTASKRIFGEVEEKEEDASFSVKFSHRGKSVIVNGISRSITPSDLLLAARTSHGIRTKDGNDDDDHDDGHGEEKNDDVVLLRLIYKGKTIAREVGLHGDVDDDDHPAFPPGTNAPRGGGIANVMIVGSATTESKVREINSSRSDPLIRGFDDGSSRAMGGRGRTASSIPMSSTTSHLWWGPHHSKQDESYKFCRLRECTDASFGSRPGASTPHAFEARRLLEKLATDPGMVTILKSRELVVGTLGEMDPIDDRIMQRVQSGGGGCLLGYNTNRGLRIDVKLRTDDLSGFRPYRELASTLIHELSHNWVSEHDVLFWTNYGQMRVEYLWRHARLMRGGVYVGGKRTASLAGISDMILPRDADEGINATSSSRGRGGGSSNDAMGDDNARTMNGICRSVIEELATEMAQHRIPAQLVAPAVLAFGGELMAETANDDTDITTGGYLLGTDSSSSSSPDRVDPTVGTSARERALAAAERRAREAKKDKS
ncbi:hypothetical protein ACHAXA_002420 [Cyclostephanos tholiformis]|uniref:WLM domain-containing protein n=1 Tax=Cyclostephanos tholiformis TaxID=382380 RepID=A0ABD3RZZ1_9STRA